MLITVKPKQGLLIVDPELRTTLPAEGCAVNDAPYWQRRIADGDVELVPTAPAAPVTAEKED